MQNKNDNFSYLASLTSHGVYQIDPLARREMGHFANQKEIGRYNLSDPMTHRELGHYARQQAMASFFIKVFKSLGAMISGWFVRSRQYQELSALPDYLLKDMGFRRDEISKVLYNELKRPEMSLSPSGPQSAPAFSQVEKDVEQETPQAA